MEKNKYMQFNKIDDSITELLIYGPILKPSLIEQWLGIEDKTRVSAFEFKEALDAVDTPNLVVRINSMGGLVSEGLAIYSLLSEFKGNLITKVDGFACSAASVIFMAGKQRIVPESGLLMIHNASSSAAGDSNAMKKAAEDLEKITQPSINIYVSKTNLSEETIKQMMDRETWISSSEALRDGFATTIEKDDNAVQSFEDSCIYRLVMRTKELENLIEINNKNKVVEPQEESDSWKSFFNERKK